MNVIVAFKDGNKVRFEEIEDFMFNDDDDALVLFGEADNLAIIPRENLLYMLEEISYDKDSLN